MKKRFAIITDIHGNIEGLNAILKDIENKNIDEIICLGDTIDIGPNSKECIDKLIDNNIKMTLGNHELYLLRGTSIDPSINNVEEIEHYKWVKNQLSEKEINFIKKCPLYYTITIDYENKKFNKEIILSHYLIEDENKDNPFEKNHLKKDINLWIKYNSSNNDYIESIDELTNIEVVDSAGCTYDEYVSYMILEISKGISMKKIKVKFDRKKFVDKIINLDFPDKNNILKYFYGIESKQNY